MITAIVLSHIYQYEIIDLYTTTNIMLYVNYTTIKEKGKGTENRLFEELYFVSAQEKVG